ncbi:hypothetical protein DY000_02011628 [Brassica cretica]|uniref:Myb-like domain-containing protein n=1 Tax=Brassica cretica TaxID=69181 RepID=A0ABQ7CNH0_BRACR|nr:hypothetical protein DY000_02011628 [Brassica cretica]
MATALSEGLGDEGKQRPFHRWLSSTKENADFSLYRWLYETGGLIKRHEPGGLMKRLSEVDGVLVLINKPEVGTMQSLCQTKNATIIKCWTDASNYGGDTAAEPKGRRKWTTTDDVVLISSWLNTRKNPVVGNEQKSSGFWKRIVAYFAASPLVAGCEEREASHCKQRWHMINDLVSKFCGSYEAATREKTSGQNETGLLKLAHQIFYNNYKKRFTLDYAWKELHHDQKCELATAKTEGSLKKRKCEYSADSSSSQATCSKLPPGVKAAKLSAKKPVVDEQTMNGFTGLWSQNQKKEFTGPWSPLTGLWSLVTGVKQKTEFTGLWSLNMEGKSNGMILIIELAKQYQ